MTNVTSLSISDMLKICSQIVFIGRALNNSHVTESNSYIFDAFKNLEEMILHKTCIFNLH